MPDDDLDEAEMAAINSGESPGCVVIETEDGSEPPKSASRRAFEAIAEEPA